MTVLDKLTAFAERMRRDALTTYFIASDARTPVLVRSLAFVIAAYALSPIDLIPDFIPILGYLDDVILLPLSIGLIIKLTPSPVLCDCRVLADKLSERISSTGGAFLVVAIWLACAVFFVYWVINRDVV